MRFGGLTAVGNLSFAARAGEITSVIGPNGAGKTTVFNCITGFYRPTSGSLQLTHADGTAYALQSLPGHNIARRARVARTFQNIRLFAGMTVLENLLVAQHNMLMPNVGAGLLAVFGLGGHRKAEAIALDRARLWLDATGLLTRADIPAGALPYGDQRRLEIARAMCTGPVLLCLDEPAAGLNPRESDQLADLLRRIRDGAIDAPCSILLIEHDMGVVMRISDHIVVLDHGRKISDGAPADIPRRPGRHRRLSRRRRRGRRRRRARGRMTLLSLTGVTAYYGAIQALRGVDLTVEPGEIVTLIGANGAGKSTLMMTICGSPQARDGTIIYDGQDITRIPTHQIMRSGIAQSPEGRRIFGRMSVHENLLMGSQVAGMAEFDTLRDQAFTLFPRLKERQHQRAGTLSGGEQQMLAIARALMTRPRLLLLDEPSLGLAPLVVRQIFTAIRDLNRTTGLTVLLVEQNAFQALRLAHRGYVLVNGSITMAGTGSDLLARPEIRAAYLEGAH